ncbi:hypothetical protein BH11ACT4_BH11ACT4_16080 [soil metagenome]
MAPAVTPRPALVFLATTLAVLCGAVSLQLYATWSYIADSRAVSSTSGDYVYLNNGKQFGYPAFVVGPEPALIAVALALTVVALVIAALTWRPRR